MKKGNPKAKMYQQRLATQMVKVSNGAIDKASAMIAAKGITEMLIASGDSLDLKRINQMAEWVVEQKLKVDNGDLVQMDDGSVYNVETGEVYEKE